MATNHQMLKRYGHLPRIELNDLDSEVVKNSAIEPEKLELVNARMCSHPDAPDAEIALSKDPGLLATQLGCESEEEADHVIQQHRRMLDNLTLRSLENTEQRATGYGSWPDGCHADYPDNHAIQVYIEYDSFPEHYMRDVTEAELDQIVEAGVWRMTREEVFDRFSGWPMLKVSSWLSDEAFRRVGCLHLQIDDGPDGQQHNIHVKAERIPGSTIGYAYFNDSTCRDHVNNRIDSSYYPGLMACTNLLCHEQGHNHNLEHQFRNQNYHHGVMSYSSPRLFYGFSTGEAPHRLPRDPSLDILIRQYGGEEVIVPEDPDNPPPNPPPEPTPGVITVEVDSIPVNLRIVLAGDDNKPDLDF